jgi:hypothetical protein
MAPFETVCLGVAALGSAVLVGATVMLFMTAAQRAMATAMIYPHPEKGGAKASNSELWLPRFVTGPR